MFYNDNNLNVLLFSNLMQEKLQVATMNGRCGWEYCDESHLIKEFYKEVEKGDMVDIANLAMMLHMRRIKLPTQQRTQPKLDIKDEWLESTEMFANKFITFVQSLKSK